MPDIAVRAARPDDVATLVALMGEFYAESGFPLPEAAAARTFAALLADPTLGQLWLLEADGAPAGYLALTLGFSMEYGGLRGFVDDLFVRAAARGRGLAAAALEEARRACEARGVRALCVEIGADDVRARRVYERAGFAPTERVLLARPLAEPVHLAT
jgi:GNAT superfamily N-acetyltransferase